MTVQEAIEDIKSIKPIVGGKSLEIAIKCMEELEQYRALGTVEELKDSLEELDRYRDLGTIKELEEALNMLMV